MTPLLPRSFLIQLQLYPQCLLFPKVSHLFRASPSTKYDSFLALDAIHEPAVAMFLFRIVPMGVYIVRVDPGAA